VLELILIILYYGFQFLNKRILFSKEASNLIKCGSKDIHNVTTLKKNKIRDKRFL